MSLSIAPLALPPTATLPASLQACSTCQRQSARLSDRSGHSWLGLSLGGLVLGFASSRGKPLAKSVRSASQAQAKPGFVQGLSVSSSRELKCKLQAVPTEKPSRTTLFTKAGADGVSLGDCPFSHSVQMALKMKGVDYDVVPCTEATKPAWLVSEVDGQMPCVVHEGVPHVDTKQILGWIENQFPGPSLAVPEEYVSVVDRSQIFPEIAAYTKNTDSSKDDELKLNLQMALTRLRTHLFSLPVDTRFLAGDTPSLLDCDLLPKLYVLQNATKHFKGYSLDDLMVTDDVRMYYERASALPPFVDSCYPPDVCISGWQQARGG